MRTMKEMLENKFGRLKPFEYVAGTRKVNPKYRCKCDCGAVCLVSTQNLRSGKTKSCGCISSEKTAERNRKHSGTFTPEYSVWCGIKNRCGNPNATSYEHYGGRGIKVCDRWLDSFDNFLSDLGKRPSKQHSIERINVDGDYEPSNCKWATAIEQANNKRIFSNNKSGVKGVTFSKYHSAWISLWQEDGKQKKKHFSIKKYGHEKSFQMAVKKRKEMEANRE